MRNRSSVPILRGISIAVLSIALVLGVVALIGYSRQRNNYPRGMTIAGVHVGGVDPQIASQRVLQVSSSPIEVQGYTIGMLDEAMRWSSTIVSAGRASSGRLQNTRRAPL